jgi:isoaspartyl peptidase/L-asparaginase-like protein (Ntn-hydrolase superfamily)
MNTRRKFLKQSAIATGGLLLPTFISASAEEYFGTKKVPSAKGNPTILSTWNHGLPANAKAWQILQAGGSALDAAEQGVRVVEDDPENQSVGLGGRPDRDGNVTLDACIQNHLSQCGAVSFLQHIKNPISVARKVMELTPHVMLSGDGAFQFALAQGFRKENLLTEKSKKDWETWLIESTYEPVINIENHDTIGMLVLDDEGILAGSCTTSGMAYKLHGRVGDSPIIGAGLFVDGEVGAACATGMGEAVIRVAGSAMVVELMRQGAKPEVACREVVERIVRKHSDLTNLQVGFLALDVNGNHGGYSVYAGFDYALRTAQKEALVKTKYTLEW